RQEGARIPGQGAEPIGRPARGDGRGSLKIGGRILATARALMTAEEFLAADLGEGLHELVRGEVIELPPPMPEHGVVCGNGYYVLSTFGRQTGYGYALTNDTAVLTERGPDTLRGADVCFYSHARLPRSEIGPHLAPVVPDVI